MTLSVSDRFTTARFNRDLAWLRIRGYGLWVKWSRDPEAPDLFGTRNRAHYIGRLRWKALRPDRRLGP